MEESARIDLMEQMDEGVPIVGSLKSGDVGLVLDHDVPREDDHWEELLKCTQDEIAMHGLQKFSVVVRRW